MRTPPGFGYYPQRSADGELAGGDALNQSAFECAALLGTIGVDAAELSVEARTRLAKGRFASFAEQIQAKLSENLRVVAALQFHVAEQHPVTAEAARRAEAGNGIMLPSHNKIEPRMDSDAHRLCEAWSKIFLSTFTPAYD